MDKTLHVARSELILGGQKSGKSRRAEALAQAWLAQSSQHHAVLIATAQPWDDEMRARIARHQSDRRQRVPGMTTVEEPLQLALAISVHSTPQTLIVVDCLTLWLTNWLMPADEPVVFGKSAPRSCQLAPNDAMSPRFDPMHQGGKPNSHAQPDLEQENSASFMPLAHINQAPTAMLFEAIQHAPGPLVLVGNEIGLGVIPMGKEVRAFVDALGVLNQSVAQLCQRVTLMAAGLPLTLKDST